MKPHAFVAMPFGHKPDAHGGTIDFNRVYAELIVPALEGAGLEVFRADQETRAGDIRPDMFQELLLADLVLVDITIDNPNVWYELGVRHALRARGVVLVAGGQTPKAFDIYTERKLRYGLKDGAPDPATVAADIERLTTMVTSTLQAWHGRKDSPVYNLLPHLQEPDWKALKVGQVLEFWEKHDAWTTRLKQARAGRLIGDLLVLADEAPVAALRADAWIQAGEELRKAERFQFALEQYERGLAVDPTNLKGLAGKGMCLERLALLGEPEFTLQRARDHYAPLVTPRPVNSEIGSLAARVEKSAWIAAWRRAGSSVEQRRADAGDEQALLQAAIDAYYRAFRADPAHYFAGINVLTLMHLDKDLTGDTSHDADLDMLTGAVRFAARCAADGGDRYWALVTLAELEVLSGTPSTTKAAYKAAVAKNEGDWFALNSSRAQLLILEDLNVRPETVDAGIAVFDRALERAPVPAAEPSLVLLFSGHLVDAADRQEPRLPEAKLPAAAARIGEALAALGAGQGDIAFTQGACGSDILFTEACLARQVDVRWLQPFPEPEFIERSVARCGAGWRDRYHAAKSRLARPPRNAPDALGPLPRGATRAQAYERCNRWLLHSALSYGVKRTRFICVWNGGEGDGGGGTQHMYHEVKRRTGQVTWIDTRTL
jgi:tetratricopeptide (TPR) repeat protein